MLGATTQTYLAVPLHRLHTRLLCMLRTDGSSSTRYRALIPAKHPISVSMGLAFLHVRAVLGRSTCNHPGAAVRGPSPACSWENQIRCAVIVISAAEGSQYGAVLAVSVQTTPTCSNKKPARNVAANRASMAGADPLLIAPGSKGKLRLETSHLPGTEMSA